MSIAAPVCTCRPGRNLSDTRPDESDTHTSLDSRRAAHFSSPWTRATLGNAGQSDTQPAGTIDRSSFSS